jgi:hypothetical protein
MILFTVFVPIAGAADLQGRYALSLHTVTRTRLPLLGWTSSETTSEALVDIFDRDGTPWQRQEVCDVRVASRGVVAAKVIVPDAFVESLPVKQHPIELTARGDGTWTYRADLGVDEVGFDSRQAQGKVPRTLDDPGVVDGDGDGRPGVTILVDAPVLGRAELYVVQRGSMVLDGTVLRDGGVAGTVTLGPVEQHTIAASNRLLVASPRIEPMSEASWFRLTPVPSTARCEDITSPSP